MEVHLPCSAAVLTESKASFVKLGDLPVPYFFNNSGKGFFTYANIVCNTEFSAIIDNIRNKDENNNINKIHRAIINIWVLFLF